MTSTHLSALHPHLCFPWCDQEDLPWISAFRWKVSAPLGYSAHSYRSSFLSSESVSTLHWVIPFSIKHSDIPSIFSLYHFSTGYCPISLSLLAAKQLEELYMLCASNSLLPVFLKPSSFQFLLSLFTRAALVKATKFLNCQSVLSSPLPSPSVA